jgi:hypothetical protein
MQRLVNVLARFLIGEDQKVHQLIVQACEGRQLQALLDYLETFGVTRVIFPSREYRSDNVGRRRNARSSMYDTAPLMPRGDDGGFAERFLRDRRPNS